LSEAAAWQELDAVAVELDLALPPSFLVRARAYLAELDRWQPVVSLTGYRTPGLRVQHLLTESLLFLRVLPAPAPPLIDIGTGAGIPGLVLACARPTWAVTLVEANRRRANFLRQARRLLDLPAVEVMHGRAETLARSGLAGQFRVATMRAVPGGASAYAVARPFLRPDGHLVVSLPPAGAVPKGGRVQEVVARASGELPWRRRFLILPGTEIATGVSRGTFGTAGAKHGRRQPKGGRREDDDCREPGGGAGAGRSAHPAG